MTYLPYKKSVATYAITLLLTCFAWPTTTTAEDAAATQPASPAAKGFDLEGSDAKAIDIADETMLAMGGYEAWEQTKIITWRFFGKRLHVWNKHTGDIRVEYYEKESGYAIVVLMNVNTEAGRAWRGDKEITNEKQLGIMLKSGKAKWINDSYWLVMPYKLKDSGVTLKYVGEGETKKGKAADVLQLTFKGVGVTPQNKYEVYVGKESGLVEQWSFYRKASDEKPAFVGPWEEWAKFGRIMLAPKHGNNMHTDVAVFEEVDEKVFTDSGAIDLGVK